MVRKYEYEGFGNVISTTGTIQDNIRFTGKEIDETGLYYFGARYYNPSLGRFTSPDPHLVNPGNINLQEPQSINPYVYCNNNPLKYVDENGKVHIDVETGKVVKPKEIYNEIMKSEYIGELLRGKEMNVKFVVPVGIMHKPTSIDIGGIETYGKTIKYIPYDEYNRLYLEMRGEKYTTTKEFFYGISEHYRESKLYFERIVELGTEYKTNRIVLQLRFGVERVKGIDPNEEPFAITGTLEDFNEKLKEFNLEIYKNDERDKWDIREIK